MYLFILNSHCIVQLIVNSLLLIFAAFTPLQAYNSHTTRMLPQPHPLQWCHSPPPPPPLLASSVCCSVCRRPCSTPTCVSSPRPTTAFLTTPAARSHSPAACRRWPTAGARRSSCRPSIAPVLLRCFRPDVWPCGSPRPCRWCTCSTTRRWGTSRWCIAAPGKPRPGLPRRRRLFGVATLPCSTWRGWPWWPCSRGRWCTRWMGTEPGALTATPLPMEKALVTWAPTASAKLNTQTRNLFQAWGRTPESRISCSAGSRERPTTNRLD